MRKNLIIQIGVAIITLYIALLVLQHFWVDPFQANMQKLVSRKSVQDIRSAESNLLKMGPPIVPQLLSELEIITNTLTESEIYRWSSGSTVSPNAKPVLAREGIYNIISTLSANTYERIIVESSKSNNPELCVVLAGADFESLLALPRGDLFNISNSLENVLQSRTAADGEKSCITNFFNCLRFQEKVSANK